jgi:hypothetical protein
VKFFLSLTGNFRAMHFLVEVGRVKNNVRRMDLGFPAIK